MAELIVIESKAYDKLQDEQIERFKKALIEAKLEVSQIMADKTNMLPLEEAMKILPYKSKTKWQQMRDSGQIEFSKFGRKILYSRQSLLNYIKKNNVKMV